MTFLWYLSAGGQTRDPVLDLWFKAKQWKAVLETAKIGDRLIAEGQITEIEKRSLSLKNCEVIEIIPKKPELSLFPPDKS